MSLRDLDRKGRNCFARGRTEVGVIWDRFFFLGFLGLGSRAMKSEKGLRTERNCGVRVLGSAVSSVSRMESIGEIDRERERERE